MNPCSGKHTLPLNASRLVYLSSLAWWNCAPNHVAASDRVRSTRSEQLFLIGTRFGDTIYLLLAQIKVPILLARFSIPAPEYPMDSLARRSAELWTVSGLRLCTATTRYSDETVFQLQHEMRVSIPRIDLLMRWMRFGFPSWCVRCCHLFGGFFIALSGLVESASRLSFSWYYLRCASRGEVKLDEIKWSISGISWGLCQLCIFVMVFSDLKDG